jgi:hypothetical protein
MKVYIVMQSYKDWEEGWDNVMEVHMAESAAIIRAEYLQKMETDYHIDYEVEVHEVIK